MTMRTFVMSVSYPLTFEKGNNIVKGAGGWGEATGAKTFQSRENTNDQKHMKRCATQLVIKTQTIFF